MTEREKYLEELIAQTFLNSEGEFMCPFNLGIYEYCKGCPIEGLCDEAEKIIKKAEAAESDK